MTHLYGADPDDSNPDGNFAYLNDRDDLVCVCGVARSEHALCGCPEGFQSPDDWKRERAFIESLDDHEYERLYGIT